MANISPNLTYLSIKAIHRDYFPMFNLKTVRNMIVQNVPHFKFGNRILVRKSELDSYLEKLNTSQTKTE